MVTAIIAAAGSGKRMGEGLNKVFIRLGAEPILLHSFRAFAACPEIDDIIVVAAPGEEAAVKSLLAAAQCEKNWQVICGGAERQYSIANAIDCVPDKTDLIAIHDGARPLVELLVISAVIAAARESGAAGVAVPVKDTIKAVDAEGYVVDTPDRSRLWAIQTPQVFDAALLRRAYAAAEAEGFLGTDDAALVERVGAKVKIVQGSYSNIKITTPEDLITAKAIVDKGAETMLRVGVGYDVHKLVKGRKLILGGVEVPFELGLEGHSDADVALHALKDALLGAAALGDIGRHFPDSDESYKGISSLTLLAKVRDLLAEKGWVGNNVDLVIVAEKPKLAPYVQLMNANIAETLNMDPGQVNVKATTTEGLGFAGRKEGIAAHAVVSIIRADR